MEIIEKVVFTNGDCEQSGMESGRLSIELHLESSINQEWPMFCVGSVNHLPTNMPATSPCFCFIILSSLLLPTLFTITTSSESEPEDESEFTYSEDSGKGPNRWSHIKDEWHACNNGALQSPIDLHDARVQVLPSLGKLKRDYKPAPAVLKNRGHDVAVEWKGYAGQIYINGTYFKLRQCHWHSPSEHTINGSRYKLELHIVHSSSDNNKIAVIGITYVFGRPDPFLSKLLHHSLSVLPGEEMELGTVNPGYIKFGSRKYYRYIGSLTVPPCTEGVIWTISKKVRTASREQVRALREIVHDGFEANARPTREADERTIFMYESRRPGGST